jgi:hypothetical protein
MGYEKGQSGNPKGRPKGALNRSTKELRTLIRDTVDFSEIVGKLNTLAKEGNLPAVKMLFAYGYGNPDSVSDSFDRDYSERLGLDLDL